MKVPDKTANKKESVKKKRGVHKSKPKKEQVLVVAQEIKYARWLSGNDKKSRDRVLVALKKWILNCFEKGHVFKEEDFTRVWKGLFYAMWMSDKPLVQEELCENIAKVLDLFPAEQLEHALLMTKAGFKMLATEWYGIDHHRMDKFLMLVRRYLRGSLRCLERCEWSLDSCERYAQMLTGTDGLFSLQTPHYARNATSMLLHFTDCFLEELAKVSEGKIPEDSTAALLHPFVQYMCAGAAPALCSASRRLLTALVRQSDAGLQYEHKTRAWKQMGCPGEGPDSLELVSDDEPMENGDAAVSSDEESEDRRGARALDPRAGRVDVEIARLPVPARQLAAALRRQVARAGSAPRLRGLICLQRFEALAAGQYPLPVETPPAPPAPPTPPRRAARALQRLELKLKDDADELKLRGLSRKHRKRLLRKCRAGLSIVEDVQRTRRAHANDSHNGDWLVESTESKPNKAEKDTSNKENQQKSSGHKRKHKADLAAGDAGATKLKLDKHKKKTKLNLVDDEQNGTKKRDLVNNNENEHELTKKSNIVKIQNKKDKTKIKSHKDKLNDETNGTKKHDVKAKDKGTKHTKDVKHGLAKDSKGSKDKKSKNQPQIISHKRETSNKTGNNKTKTSETSNKENKTKINDKEKTKINEIAENSDAKADKKNKKSEKPTFLVNKVKKFQKQFPGKDKKEKKDSTTKKSTEEAAKKVKFALKNNSMQKPVDYYKSVQQSPSIPFDSARKPSKTNLKPSTPSPINPFFKKKPRIKN